MFSQEIDLLIEQDSRPLLNLGGSNPTDDYALAPVI
jgi:hypothetical protein